MKRYDHHLLFLAVFAVHLLACDDYRREHVVTTCYVPDTSQATVVNSFNLCNCTNKGALIWINRIYQASDKDAVLSVLEDYKKDYETYPRVTKESVDALVKVKAHLAENSGVFYTLEGFKNQAAYEYAIWQHHRYLLSASKRDNPLKCPLTYEQIERGDIPVCLPNHEQLNSIVLNPTPWIVGGGMALLMLILLIWFGIAHPPRPKQSPTVVAPPPQKAELPKANMMPPKPSRKTQVVETPKPKPDPSPPPVAVSMAIKAPPQPEPPKEPVIQPVMADDAPIARPKPKLLYARPYGNTFHHVSETFEPNETFFVLSVYPDDPNTASVSLTDDPATREYLFTQMAGYQSICELMGAEMLIAEKVREIEPGSAILSNGYWTIQSKIKIDW